VLQELKDMVAQGAILALDTGTDRGHLLAQLLAQVEHRVAQSGNGLRHAVERLFESLAVVAQGRVQFPERARLSSLS